MRLYITRHGESEANRLNIISDRDLPHGLTEAGRLQARLLAERLQDKPITRVYASPILRARQTGEILADLLSVPLEIVAALRERDNGIWDGRGDAEAWAAVDGWMKEWLSGESLNDGPAGGETYHQVRTRVAGFLSNLIEMYGQSTDEFVLVSHGAAMLFGLPELVEGLDAREMLDHGLRYAEYYCIDCLEGKLVYRRGGSVQT